MMIALHPKSRAMNGSATGVRDSFPLSANIGFIAVACNSGYKTKTTQNFHQLEKTTKQVTGYTRRRPCEGRGTQRGGSGGAVSR